MAVSRPSSLLAFATPSRAAGIPVPSGPASGDDVEATERQLRIQRGRNLADQGKRLETLAEVVEPAGILVGLASRPGETFAALGQIVRSTAQGDLGTAASQANAFVKEAVHPEGGAGEVIHKGGLFLKAAGAGIVGGLEIQQAIQNKDLSLGILGGAEVTLGLSAAASACHQPALALGLCAASAAVKTGMMIARPEDYSRLQKVTTACEIVEALSETMLEAGIVPLASLAVRLAAPAVAALYANHAGVQARVDAAIDRATS